MKQLGKISNVGSPVENSEIKGLKMRNGFSHSCRTISNGEESSSV